MADRPVDALWARDQTAKKLAALGITTVRELAHSDAELLTSTFGPRTGLWLLLLAKGGGDADVSAEPWVPRSRSHVATFPRDLTDRTEMDSAITELAERALDDVVDVGRIVTRVAVTVRTATFTPVPRSASWRRPPPTATSSSPPPCASWASSSWIGRSGYSGYGWNSRRPSSFSAAPGWAEVPA